MATAPQATLRGRLARARALDHVADVVEPVQQRAAEVRVPGPRHDDRLGGGLPAGRRLDGQRVAPVGGVAVGDEERERRAGGAAVAHAAEDAHAVLLDALPLAAAVAALAPAQLRVDRRPGRRASPAGQPSRTAVSPGPCDSPAVR